MGKVNRNMDLQATLLKYRHVDANYHDRVRHLLAICPKQPKMDKFDPSRIRKIFRDMESNLAKQSSYNLVLENLPKYATEAETNKTVQITYTALRDTFDQFGKVDNIQIINGTGVVYFKFRKEEDADTVFKLVNKMQIGNNIVTLKRV